MEAHECVRVEDLCELDPWFNSLPAPGFWVILDTLHSGRTRIFNGHRLVSRIPRAQVERSILSTIEELSSTTPDQARASLGETSKRVAAEAGAPGLAFVLGAIGESCVAERRIKLSHFVKDYVIRQTGPFELEPLCQAARLRGLDVTENVARNAVAATADVYPVGKSTFATSGMLFGIPSEDRVKAAAFAEKSIESRPERQFHAEELLSAIGDELGNPALAAVGDVHRLSALLRFRSNVRSLGRLIFISKSAPKDTERLELLPLAQRILGEVGHPLDEGDLLRRMSEVRGVGRFSVQALLSGLTEVQPDIYWLDDQWRTKVSLEDEMLLEDVYSVVSPGELLSATEIRRRLAQRAGEHALEIAPSHLRTLIAGDDRFTSGPGGLILLKNIPNRRNPFDAVAL